MEILIVGVHISWNFRGGEFPLGSLSKNYGMNAIGSANYYYKTNNNLLIGVDWTYLFW